MGQRGFWDEEERNKKLRQKKPALARLSEAIPWDSFRPLLEKAFTKERKSNAGRKRIDPIILFKMLVLQQLFNLSDEELEFQVNDRRSFEKFLDLGIMNTIPDATTIRLFREKLRQAGIIEELFETFEQHLKSQDLEAKGGQIIDATIVPIRKQRNTREENKDIKQGKVPEAWKKNPNRLRQKDLDARWVKKNNLNYYGYKNSICIDAKYGFIRRHVITPANRHDSQILMVLLDGENKEDMVWADSGYAGRIFADVLQLAGYDNQIQEKGNRHHPLSDVAKASNRKKAKIRARVEHVFGQIKMKMRSKLTRCVGLARTKAWWCLRNLVFNFLRFTQHKYGFAIAN